MMATPRTSPPPSTGLSSDPLNSSHDGSLAKEAPQVEVQQDHNKQTSTEACIVFPNGTSMIQHQHQGEGSGDQKGGTMTSQKGSSRDTAPKSRYYAGPPVGETVFGSEPAGVVGRDLPREIIRLERDYSLAPSHIPQYHSTFPLELEGRLPVSRFCEAMNEINEIMIQANDPTWAAVDNGMAVMTFWISPWIVGSRYARKMKEFDHLVNKLNEDLFQPAGLRLLHPRKVAWLYLEVEYY